MYYEVPVVDARNSGAGKGETAMLRSIAFAFFLSVAPATAFANQCPTIMAAIDAALPTATLADADMGNTQEIRAPGTKSHSDSEPLGRGVSPPKRKKI